MCLHRAQVMIYNLRAATFITLLSSLLFGVLRVYQILPDDERTVALGYAVFLLVMCFWQRVREAWHHAFGLLPPPHVFCSYRLGPKKLTSSWTMPALVPGMLSQAPLDVSGHLAYEVPTRSCRRLNGRNIAPATIEPRSSHV